MKTSKNLITAALALLILTLLTGCGGTAKDSGKTEDSVKTEAVKDAAEVKEPEPAETINKYTSENGMYAISLPGEWTEEDNMGVPGILNLSGSNDAGAMVLGMEKSQMSVLEVESLQDFYDFADESFLNGEASTASLTAADVIPLTGFVDSLAMEGEMTQSNGASGDLFVQCVESENAYYMIMFSAASKYDEMITSIRSGMDFEELEVPEPVVLSDTLCWFNATYAVITNLNGGDLNVVAGYEPGDMIEQLEQSLLERDWGVTDRASLDETIDWVLTEGHNAEALSILTGIGADGMSREQLAAAMDSGEFEEGEKFMLLAAYDAKAAYGENAIAGWDLSRAMSLMGWGYLAGYYTYEEAMDMSLETAKAIQQTFSSWDDFFNSYFLGYSYWSEQSLEDPASQAHERRQVYEELKSDPNGVFRVDWNTELSKDW